MCIIDVLKDNWEKERERERNEEDETKKEKQDEEGDERNKKWLIVWIWKR